LESPWLKQFALQLNLCIFFPSFKSFSHEILPNLVHKTKYVYVLPEPFCYMLATTCFDLWMSKGIYYIFAWVINFLNENLQPKKVIIGLLEATETIGQALAKI
jgi:hypothetical protein